jgi:DNA helicase-2/ATP-dependent DNA helicase PcrA
MDSKDERSEYVTLMTIHTSKWLEEKNVFVTGIEEWIFPSFRSVNDNHALEEERRLMYVAMTRARENLYLSRAKERFHFWDYVRNPESRFLWEIAAEFLENYSLSQSDLGNSSFFSSSIPSIWWESQTTSTIKKVKIQDNDVSLFKRWERVSHPKFWNGIITLLNWELAEIAFEWVWVKKMNIRIAPVRKI